ncbi:MAG: ATP-binding protein, partial [Candidatus Competibacteraceae bacterium]|nr:ATP-binding protein [Candidatus Competibacteraceae bacterium]
MLAASLVLVAFLGLAGLTLDRAYRDGALAALQERLQAQVYMLLGAANLDEQNRLQLPQALPEPRLSTPGSGLYAAVTDGQGRTLWRSRSLLGLSVAFPVSDSPGQPLFTQIDTSGGSPLLALSFGVAWEVAPDDYRRYTFQVAEARRGFDGQLGAFRRSLWVWLGALGVGLLLVQGLILRWSLKPLRQVAREVAGIEAGRRQQLTGPYPRELQPLTRNLNALIHNGQLHLERYRNALADLAHSLKTPLAVLRGASHEQPDTLGETVREQVERMDRTVDYQLSRAAASGRTALTRPVTVAPVGRKLLDALGKVYAAKGLALELKADDQARFFGDEGDLMEILGNLADNACKWARSRVVVIARYRPDPAGRGELTLIVEDDGPGIAEQQRAAVTDRGRRADPTTPGHGIGLAVVRELVEEVSQGRLAIQRG